MFSGKLTKLELRARWSAGDTARVEVKASTPPRASRHEVRTSLVRPMLPAAAELILKMSQSPMARRRLVVAWSRLLPGREAQRTTRGSLRTCTNNVCVGSRSQGFPPVELSDLTLSRAPGARTFTCKTKTKTGAGPLFSLTIALGKPNQTTPTG